MSSAATDKGTEVSRDAFVALYGTWLKDREPRLTESQKRVGTDALEELIDLRVALFDHWYLGNSYRYGKLRELDLRPARAAVRNFIIEIQTGRLSP